MPPLYGSKMVILLYENRENVLGKQDSWSPYFIAVTRKSCRFITALLSDL